MSELIDCVMQQIDRIGIIGVRPAAVFVPFDERHENIELVAVFSIRCGAPQFFDLAQSCGVIVRYTPYGNDVESITSLVNGVRLKAGSGGALSRVAGVLAFAPGQ